MSQATQALATMSVDDARAIVSETRAERLAQQRQFLQQAVHRNPNGKLAAKAHALLLDQDIYEDKVAEAGGEDGLTFIICAQVASGVLLKTWCAHYGVDRGLIWAMLSETPERYERYKRALAGVADEFIGDAVPLADGSSVESAVVDKLQIDTRLKVAAMYDPSRFGKQTKVTHEVGADFGEMLRRARERVIEGEVLRAVAAVAE